MCMTVFRRGGMEVRCPSFPQDRHVSLIQVLTIDIALHFHLTVADSGEAYEDAEFIYQPLLNEQRDKELLDLLPEYLTEEICFPRGQAAKFYCKVMDSMSKKIILEDE
jgi:hypothetical protein